MYIILTMQECDDYLSYDTYLSCIWLWLLILTWHLVCSTGSLCL